jgi:hypothetical protein
MLPYLSGTETLIYIAAGLVAFAIAVGLERLG